MPVKQEARQPLHLPPPVLLRWAALHGMPSETIRTRLIRPPWPTLMAGMGGRRAHEIYLFFITLHPHPVRLFALAGDLLHHQSATYGPPRSCLCLSHSTRAQAGPAVLVPALLLVSSDKTSWTSCADSAVWDTRGISSCARASWSKSNGPPRLRVFTTTSRYGYAVSSFPAEPGAAAKCPASP